MRIYIWTSAITVTLGIFISALRLAFAKYPRTEEISAGVDTLALMIRMVVLGWCVYLLIRF